MSQHARKRNAETSDDSQLANRVRRAFTYSWTESMFDRCARPSQEGLCEYSLSKRGLVFSFDGAFIDGCCQVFIVSRPCIPIEEVDYFHGCKSGIPVCQTVSEFRDYRADEMIVTTGGFVVKCIVRVQRLYRCIRSQRYSVKMIRKGQAPDASANLGIV